MSRRLSHTCAVAAALSMCAAIACNPTSGVPIELTLAFEALGPRTFTTVSGWEVELDEARAVVAALYAYAPEDELSFSFLRALAPARAFAHGGHSPLDGRRVRAELLETVVVDALAEGADVATVDGLEGAVDTLTIVLGGGSEHGDSVWVAGRARRDGVDVAFAGGLTLRDERLRRIDGVAVAPGVPLTQGARLVVGTDVRAWLAEADFAEFSNEAVIADGTQPHRALYLGARSAASWSARIEASGEGELRD